jgi:ribosomal-protein-alanine N-acetyltransferase
MSESQMRRVVDAARSLAELLGVRMTTPTHPHRPDVFVRWMLRRDMPQVLEIERDSFEFPWRQSDFIDTLRCCNCIGMVAECDDRVVGFMIYSLHKNFLYLINFAVAPEFRKLGVGQAMAQKLKGKLPHGRRRRITLHVRETNLAAQLFFRSQGFRAVKVERDFYELGGVEESAYKMSYVFGEKP